MVVSVFRSLFRMKTKSLSKYKKNLKKYVEQYSNIDHIESFLKSLKKSEQQQ